MRERDTLSDQVTKKAFSLDNRTVQLLQLTAEFFRDQRQQAFLVGGSLRNILLGEPCNDWDIVTPGDAPTLVRGLADRLGGFYARMHEKASRVVVPTVIAQPDEGEDHKEVAGTANSEETEKGKEREV